MFVFYLDTIDCVNSFTIEQIISKYHRSWRCFIFYIINKKLYFKFKASDGTTRIQNFPCRAPIFQKEVPTIDSTYCLNFYEIPYYYINKNAFQ